jgi:hypothetical protein
MVPAMAMPSDEPRLETLRDSPEISPAGPRESRLGHVERRGQHHAQADQQADSDDGGDEADQEADMEPNPQPEPEGR